MRLPAATRRRFFSFMGATPLAAKTALDQEIGRAAGLTNALGLGSSGMAPASDGNQVGRAVGAAQHLKLFGLPGVIESELRNNAQYVYYLDPDIACKRSWSMAVKIMTQRQRNYERAVERIRQNGWRAPAREALKTMLGFEWPW